MATSSDPAPATGTQSRRSEDATVLLFAGDRTAAHGIAAHPATFDPTPEQLANAAFLIDLTGDDALVVPAAEAHLVPRGAGGAELQARAATMAQALRRERDRLKRRLRMPDHLIRYAEALQRARSETAVYEALRDVAAPVVSAYTAPVFVATGEGIEASFQPLADPALRLPLAAIPAETATRFIEPRLVTRTEIEASRTGPLAALMALIEVTGASQLLCAPVGADALLVLIERRRGRVLAGDDRDLLGALVRQAECTLRRLAIERRVTSLTLTDPLTWLPAGRHMEVLMEHALALAERGHPLALILIDLEEATVPDREADDALDGLAACLNEQLRHTDLVMRHGTRRFVVVLAGTDAAGADIVMRRIEAQVGGALSLRAGVAVFGPEMDTAERLTRAAAENLAARGAPPS